MSNYKEAYQLLDDDNKKKVNNWLKCKKIYKDIEILLYNSNEYNDFNAIKQLNYFYKECYNIEDYIENDKDVHVEYNNKIYVWSIHDDFIDCEYYDMNILKLIKPKHIFIACCQIFLYYYNLYYRKKLLQYYKLSFFYTKNYYKAKLIIYKNKQIKFNDKYFYNIEWIEQNNYKIYKNISDYNHLSKYDDNCILFVLLLNKN